MADGSLEDSASAESEMMVTVAGNATLEPGEAGEAGELGDGHAVGASRHQAGDQIGRYLLVERIGRGGMGVVYSAYDPELDRKIALKLLRPDSKSNSGASRLMREAQAMARLSHPNVITVHDVGRLEDASVFIAMEFIDGPTLATWQREPGRRVDEILDVYIKAGRGLAAAHDAQMVHRDFKPENVLVGRDGRVRVLDFGLARQQASLSRASRSGPGRTGDDVAGGEHDDADAGQVGHAEHDGDEQASRSDELEATLGPGDLSEAQLTRTGAMVGTPAYMAPEQHAGQLVDVRSDQFAYCVALWEGLYEQRPFAGESLTAIAFSVLQGELRTTPEHSAVPERVRRALEKGLSTEPGDRYASMHELLAQLGPPEQSARTGVLAAAGVAAVGLALALGLAIGDSGEAGPCERVDAEIETVWTPARADEIAKAFAATDLPFAEDASRRTNSELDAWAEAWRMQRVDACEATRVRAQQSEVLMDLRMACLTRRLAELRGVVSTFAKADARTVSSAASAVESLPELSACEDTQALLADVSPAHERPSGAAVDALRARLDAVTAARVAGDKAGVRLAAEDALEQARALDYPPLVSEAALAAAQARSDQYDFDEAEAALRLAILGAERSGDARVGAKAWTEMLGLQSDARVALEAADEADAHAQAYLGRLDEQDPQHGIYLRNRASLLEWKGDYRGSIALNEQALARLVAKGSEVSLASSAIYTAIGNAHWELGEFDQALRFHEKAYALDLEVLGRAHPSIADGLSNMGLIYDERGEYQKARGYYERAIAIIEASGQVDHGALGVFHNNIASTFIEDGRWADAASHYRTAQEHWRAAYGDSHPDIAMVLTNLALVDEHLGELDAALAKYDAAITIQERHFGDKHRETAWTRAARADILRLLGRFDEAATILHRSIEQSIAAVGDAHEDVAQERIHLGRVLLDMGRYTHARAEFDRVVENRLGRHDASHNSVLRARGLAAVAGHELRLAGEEAVALEQELAAVAAALVQRPVADEAHALIHFTYARALAKTSPAQALEAAQAAWSFYETAPPHHAAMRAKVEALLRRLGA